MDSKLAASSCKRQDENDTLSKGSIGPSKRLTVTFRHIDVLVNGLGDDFAPTCWSVIENLIPFRRRKVSKKVNKSLPIHYFARQTNLQVLSSTSFRMFLVRFDLGRWYASPKLGRSST